MGRGRVRCADNGVLVEEALVFRGRGIGVFVQFRGRVIGVFVIAALGFSSNFVVVATLCMRSMSVCRRLESTESIPPGEQNGTQHGFNTRSFVTVNGSRP